ncbi:MAG: DUF1292 domain-containing protein [Lachnospiraceae bacterium]|nr:DUF1292 domain-containing protein [Lachnospiraceae bacterium]
MINNSNTIVLTTEDGETLELYVLEKTRINGKDYLLTADGSLDDEDSDEAECYIFRDDSLPGDSEAVYVMVENEDELVGVLDIFQNLMDDVSIEN